MRGAWLHTLKSHDAGTSQATTQLYPGVFQHPIRYVEPAVGWNDDE